MKRLIIGVAAGLFMSGSGLVLAADSFVQGFSSSESLQIGLVVSLDGSLPKTVEINPGGNPNRIYGVVIDPSSAPATLVEGGEDVFVATGGQYPVLASVEYGSIAPGDYLSISSFDGVAAKATDNQAIVLGRALQSFDGTSEVLTKTSSGDAIGQVAVDVNVGPNPLFENQVLVPGPLRNAGEAVAGKNVSSIRLYAALVLLLATMLMAAGLLWVGVRNGMIAIGRNPLSKHSILGSLVQVLMVAVLVFIIGVFGVYLLLKI